MSSDIYHMDHYINSQSQSETTSVLLKLKPFRETWVWGQAAQEEAASRLWELSDQMTQV